MGMFDDVGNSRAKVDASYFRPGQYLLRIDRVKPGKSRKNRDFVAVEMTVLKCIQPAAGAEPHVPGEAVSQLFFQDSDYFLPEVKAFVMGAMGCTAEEVTSAVCEAMLDPKSQPFADIVVEVHAKSRVTKEGKDFTAVAFKRPVSYKAIQAKNASAGGFLTDAEIARFFPGDKLAALVAGEASVEAAARQTDKA